MFKYSYVITLNVKMLQCNNNIPKILLRIMNCLICVRQIRLNKSLIEAVGAYNKKYTCRIDIDGIY